MNRAELQSCLENRYTVDELETKCFTANIEYQNLSRERLSTFVRELISYCERTGRLEWLDGLCSETGGQPSAATSTAKLREHDFAILSDCHASLHALRNVFENRLPVPQLRDHHVRHVGMLALKALSNAGELKRTMGDEWAKELANTVAEVVTLDHGLAGRDMLKEAKELQSRPPDEVMAFFGEFQEKRKLMDRLDRLILDLEARLS